MDKSKCCDNCKYGYVLSGQQISPEPCRSCMPARKNWTATNSAPEYKEKPAEPRSCGNCGWINKKDRDVCDNPEKEYTVCDDGRGACNHWQSQTKLKIEWETCVGCGGMGRTPNLPHTRSLRCEKCNGTGKVDRNIALSKIPEPPKEQEIHSCKNCHYEINDVGRCEHCEDYEMWVECAKEKPKEQAKPDDVDRDIDCILADYYQEIDTTTTTLERLDKHYAQKHAQSMRDMAGVIKDKLIDEFKQINSEYWDSRLSELSEWSIPEVINKVFEDIEKELSGGSR